MTRRLGGTERKEVLKLGRWEKRKEITNDKCQSQSHNTDYTDNKKNMDFTDDKKTGRNGEKGSFENRKLGR